MFVESVKKSVRRRGEVRAAGNAHGRVRCVFEAARETDIGNGAQEETTPGAMALGGLAVEWSRCA